MCNWWFSLLRLALPSSLGSTASLALFSSSHFSYSRVLLGRRWRIELTRYRGITPGSFRFRQGAMELEVNEQGQEVARNSQEYASHASNSLPLVS
jgi:hypothetical protein